MVASGPLVELHEVGEVGDQGVKPGAIARAVVVFGAWVSLAAAVVLVGPAAAQDGGEQSVAQRCFKHHKFGREPVDVAKSADGQTVLAQVSWNWHDNIGCYLTLDEVAVAALQMAPPSSSLPGVATDVSRRCFAHHKFGERPVEVAKSADRKTVLARLSWGFHDAIGCYLVLDDAALTTLRADAQPDPTAEPTPDPTPEPTAEPTPDPTPSPTPDPADDDSDILTAEAEMARLVNELRRNLGLAPLAYNADVARVARNWSQTMRDTGEFIHNPIYAFQYPPGWYLAGENIAWVSGLALLDAVQYAFDGLVDSPGHYANMTNPEFNALGVGIALEGSSAWFTQNFAYYS